MPTMKRIALFSRHFCLVFVLALAGPAQAASVFIPAPSRVDVVHDAARNLVYISGGTNVLRYHLGSGTFLPAYPFPVTSNLKGIDLSPDGNTLVVADRTGSATHVWVHVINLIDDTVVTVQFPRTYAEDGTWAVAFGADDAAIITSTTMGSAVVPFRRYVPATGATSVVPIYQTSMVTASAYGDFMGLAQGNNSSGPVNRYDVANRTFPKSSGTGWFNYEIGVSRDAGQFAVPTYNGCYMFDGNLTYFTKVGTYAGPQPIGVVYHPADNVVFFAWAGTTEVRAYDTTTLTQVGSYDFQHGFALPGNWAFTQGRLRISRDGTLLFSTVNGGVRYVTLAGYNRPPSATPASAAGPQGASLALSVGGSDPDGDALTFVLATSPAHGSVSGAFPNVIYTAEAGFRGTDSFTFKVNDGKALSRAAAVTLLLTNQPSSLTTVATLNGALEDQPFTISHSTLTAAADEVDPDSDPISFRVEGVAGGTLTKNGVAVVAGVTLLAAGETWVWTPPANANGAALPAFTITASDGVSSSDNPIQVAINVAPVNDTPTVGPRVLSLLEDSSATITLTGTDIDGDPLAFLIANGPTHGTLTQQGTDFTYTPAPNFNGLDSFTYKASDGQAESAEAMVAITVGAVNDAPVYAAQAAVDGATEDTPFTLTHAALLAAATASDADGDVLIFRVETILSGTLTKNGQAVSPGATLVGPGETLVWTPPANEFGSAYSIFTARLSDGTALSAATRPVTANVAPVNDGPILNPLLDLVLNEDQTTTRIVTGIGSGAANEDQTLTVTAVSSDPALLPNPVVTYASPATNASMLIAPTPNAFGSCTVTVTVSDGLDSVSRTFGVTFLSVNDRPTINQVQGMILLEDAGEQVIVLTGITAGAPNESQPLTVTAVSGYTNAIPHPTIEYTSPNSTAVLRFTPVPNSPGLGPITVSVSDGLLTSNMIFQVNVQPVNDPPTVDPIQSLVINEDAGVQTVTVTGISAGPNESQNLSLSAVSSNYSIIPFPTVSYTSPNSTGTLTFTPVPNAFGTATVSVIVQEGPGISILRTFNVVVNPVNDPPTLNALSNISFKRKIPTTVNLSGISAGPNETQILVVTAVSSNPSLVPNPTVTYTSPNSTGSLLLTAPDNDTGTTTITVTVNDGQSANNTVVRTFTVTVTK